MEGVSCAFGLLEEKTVHVVLHFSVVLAVDTIDLFEYKFC